MIHQYLYDAFGMPEFDDLYLKYEKDKSIPKTTIGEFKNCLWIY